MASSKSNLSNSQEPVTTSSVSSKELEALQKKYEHEVSSRKQMQAALAEYEATVQMLIQGMNKTPLNRGTVSISPWCLSREKDTTHFNPFYVVVCLFVIRTRVFVYVCMTNMLP